MTSLHRASRPSSARRPVPTRAGVLRPAHRRARRPPPARGRSSRTGGPVRGSRRAGGPVRGSRRAGGSCRADIGGGAVPPARSLGAVLDPPRPANGRFPWCRRGRAVRFRPLAIRRAPGAPSGQITSTGRPGRDGRGPLARRTGPAPPRSGREARGRPAPPLPSVGGSDRRCGRVLRQQVLLVGLHARHTATGDVLQPGVDRPALLLTTLVEELVERAPGAEPAAVDALRR